MDTTGLPALGAEWRGENPFRQHGQAITIGTSAHNRDCARCHGLEAISGGIVPDLRKPDNDCVNVKDACVTEIDEYFSSTVRKGRVRNGAVYMPPFVGVLGQAAVWSIKAYLETCPREAAVKRRQVLALAALPLAAQAQGLDAIRQRGRLTVAVYNDLPPFNVAGQGIDVDLARALARALGLELSLLPFNADENMGDDLRNMVWRGHYLGCGPADVLLLVRWTGR